MIVNEHNIDEAQDVRFQNGKVRLVVDSQADLGNNYQAHELKSMSWPNPGGNSTIPLLGFLSTLCLRKFPYRYLLL